MKLTGITQRKNQVNPASAGKIKRPEKLSTHQPSSDLVTPANDADEPARTPQAYRRGVRFAQDV